MMKKIAILLLSCLCILSCENQKDNDDIICTKQFESIPLKVIDKTNTPIALDSFKVMLGSRNITHQYLPEEFVYAQKAGSYTIINDRLQAELEGKKAQVVFTGYIGVEEVINESFFVSADRCHVTYIDTKPLTYTLAE